MKHFVSIIVLMLLFISCASSQKTISPEAEKKVEALRPLLKLSREQCRKLKMVETGYLEKHKSLLEANDADRIKKLDVKRSDSYKKILSHQQFIQFRAIEGGLIKKAPMH